MARRSSPPWSRRGSRRSRSRSLPRARRPRAARARRHPPSPEAALLPDELLDPRPNRLDVRLQDVAPAVATVPLEGDERWLDEQVVHFGIARASRQLDQRRQVLERKI